jgi:hypothetical protein
VEDYGRVNQVCAGVPPPGPQMDRRGRKLDPNKPLRRCGEWVEDATRELRRQGVLGE